jgi:hypothetical protein
MKVKHQIEIVVNRRFNPKSSFSANTPLLTYRERSLKNRFDQAQWHPCAFPFHSKAKIDLLQDYEYPRLAIL